MSDPEAHHMHTGSCAQEPQENISTPFPANQHFKEDSPAGHVQENMTKGSPPVSTGAHALYNFLFCHIVMYFLSYTVSYHFLDVH